MEMRWMSLEGFRNFISEMKIQLASMAVEYDMNDDWEIYKML